MKKEKRPRLIQDQALLFLENPIRIHLVLALLRYFRQICWSIAIVAIIATAVGLYYLNTVGLPQSAYDSIEQKLATNGVFVSISKLKYHALDGLTAEGVALFHSSTQETQLAQIQRALIGFDKTKALRGELKLENIQLFESDFSIPTDASDESRGVIEIDNCSALINIFQGNKFLIENLRGNIQGITLELQTKLSPANQSEWKQAGRNHQVALAEKLVLKRMVDALAQWQFSKEDRPYISLVMEGDLKQPALIKSELNLEAPLLRNPTYQINDFLLHFNIQGPYIDVSEISFRDERGTTKSEGYFDIRKNKGELNLISQSDFQSAITSFFTENPLPLVKLRGAQKVDASIALKTDSSKQLQVSAYGTMSADSIELGKLRLDQASTEFSWSGQNLFVRNLHSSVFDRNLEGKMLIDSNHVKIDVLTSLPMSNLLFLNKSEILSEIVKRGKITKAEEGKSHVQAEIPLSVLH